MLTKIINFLNKMDPGHWLLTHACWLIVAAAVYFGGRAWLQEHDQRVQTEAALKASQNTISQLQQQMAANDAAAAQKVKVITKIVHDLPPNATTGQIVAVIPQLTDAPLNARTIPGDPVDISVAAAPLVDVLKQAGIDHAENAACQIDLTAQKAIDAQKDQQIVILKRKKPFWNRVKHVAQIFGIGVAVGALLATHAL